MNPHLQEIQDIIDNQIGPAGTLGFSVQGYDGDGLTLGAPLARNLNHHGTAFGGSLFALAAVCGWGFVLLKLREVGLHGLIVVKHSSVDYLAPVSGDLQVRCGADADAVESFLQAFRERGRARLRVDGAAPGADGDALQLHSTYTVIAQPENAD